jgi:hypothetical protein
MDHFKTLPLNAQKKLFPDGFRSEDYCHSRERSNKDRTVYDCVTNGYSVLLIKNGKIWINFDDEPEGCKDLYTWSLKHPSTTVEWLHQYDRPIKDGKVIMDFTGPLDGV